VLLPVELRRLVVREGVGSAWPPSGQLLPSASSVWIQDRGARASASSNVGGALMAERLRLIFDGLQALIGEHQPAEVAVERVFVNRNVESALKLGQARGAALCAVPRGLPVFEYAPRAIKLAVVGSGAAEKGQVAHMITALLRLSGRIGPDASDALAVAVCHAHSRRLHALTQVNE